MRNSRFWNILSLSAILFACLGAHLLHFGFHPEWSQQGTSSTAEKGQSVVLRSEGEHCGIQSVDCPICDFLSKYCPEEVDSFSNPSSLGEVIRVPSWQAANAPKDTCGYLPASRAPPAFATTSA